MIEVLKSENLISLTAKDAELYRSMKNYFSWDIGSRISIFQRYDFKITNPKHKKDLENIAKTIKNLLK